MLEEFYGNGARTVWSNRRTHRSPHRKQGVSDMDETTNLLYLNELKNQTIIRNLLASP